MASKTTEWRPGPTVCRCCLTEGCYKDISTEYFWMGKREVYAEMLTETFDLSIAYSQSGGPNSHSRLICEPCISRLRDAADFKRQVQECERSFMQYLDPGSSLIDVEACTELEKEVKVERVKEERDVSDDDDFDDRPDFGDDDDYDDLDDEPLTKLASKVPKKESVDALDLIDNAKATEKRKSSSKTKGTSAKKAKTKKVIATSSKEKPEPRKKKEIKPEVSSIQMAKNNAQIVLEHSTLYPFRLRGKSMLCVYCCEEYDDPKDYRSHMDEQHKTFTVATAFAHCGSGKEFLKVDLTDLRCRKCQLPCNNLNEIAIHLRDEHGFKNINMDFEIGMQPFRMDTDKLICFLCDKKLPSLTKLCRHTTSHYLKFTCDQCGRNYLTREALKYHVRCLHTGNNVCRKCWVDFPTVEKKRDHLRTSKQCWAFACVYCGERFMSWELKQKHLVEVHGCPKRMYTCTDCDETFDCRRNFYRHYKLTHSDENFACQFCDLKFATKLRMEEHRSGHTGNKPYQCSVCKKSFPRSRSLNQHMWIHCDNKRFVCVICNKQFAQKVSLKGHMKSHHPEVTMEV